MSDSWPVELTTEDLGGFNYSEWKKMRERMRTAEIADINWKTAAEWMRGRLKTRYLDPICGMAKNSYGPGFTIVTVLCALIEHLAALEEGIIYYANEDNRPYRGYDYRNSTTTYIQFLKSAKIFKGYFFVDNRDAPPFSADDFYKNVRCALIHEACTKNSWRINTLSCGYANPDSQLFTSDEGVKRIYRDILADHMGKYLEAYVERVAESRKLQLALARKLDSLCGIMPDPEIDPNQYEWWQKLQPHQGESMLTKELKSADSATLLREVTQEIRRRIGTVQR